MEHFGFALLFNFLQKRFGSHYTWQQTRVELQIFKRSSLERVEYLEGLIVGYSVV